jgi:magnesium-transporting ATPase (P-type)
METYRYPLEDLLRELKTSAKGLSAEEARERLRRYGPNRLAEEKRTSRVAVFFRQFKSPLIYILLLAAVVTGLLKDTVDTAVILAVLIFNAVIGFVQEVRAEETESIFRLDPFGNPMLAYGLIASVLAHLGSVYLAPLQWVFHTRPIGADLWLQIIAVSLTVILAVEADKWLRKKR